MDAHRISRRTFAAAGVAAATAAASGQARLTAGQVVERIKQNVGVPWRSATADTFKSGSPDTPVKGIATTFMATVDVIRRAVSAGRNMIVTLEPTFYNHYDQTSHLAADPVYKAKRDLIDRNEIVIWRFHDHWSARQPAPYIVGLAQALGWEKYRVSEDWRRFDIPETTLERLAKDIQRRMRVKSLRVTGIPGTRVSKMALYPGLSTPMHPAKLQPDFEVYIGGETPETEGSYAADMVSLGIHKGMILLGHWVSEEPGMRLCAEWLKTLVPELSVEWTPAGEPFWTPA